MKVKKGHLCVINHDGKEYKNDIYICKRYIFIKNMNYFAILKKSQHYKSIILK